MVRSLEATHSMNNDVSSLNEEMPTSAEGPLANHTQLMRMQSFNQIGCSGEKWEERDRGIKDTKPLVDRKL